VNEYEQIVARTAPAAAAKTGVTEPAKPFYRKPSEEDLLRGSSSSHGD